MNFNFNFISGEKKIVLQQFPSKFIQAAAMACLQAPNMKTRALDISSAVHMYAHWAKIQKKLNLGYA